MNFHVDDKKMHFIGSYQAAQNCIPRISTVLCIFCVKCCSISILHSVLSKNKTVDFLSRNLLMGRKIIKFNLHSKCIVHNRNVGSNGYGNGF
jgi:hypothetical protein